MLLKLCTIQRQTLYRLVPAAIKPFLFQSYTNLHKYLFVYDFGVCCYYEMFLHQLSSVSHPSVAEEPLHLSVGLETVLMCHSFDQHIIYILSIIFLLLFMCACVSQVNWIERELLALPHTYTFDGFHNLPFTQWSGFSAFSFVCSIWC